MWETTNLNRSFPYLPTNSKPQHQPVDVFTPPNPFELPVQLLVQVFRIAVIVFIGILVLLHLHDIGNAGPVKNLQEEKRKSQGSSRRTEARILLSKPSILPPTGATQEVVNKNGANRQ